MRRPQLKFSPFSSLTLLHCVTSMISTTMKNSSLPKPAARNHSTTPKTRSDWGIIHNWVLFSINKKILFVGERYILCLYNFYRSTCTQRADTHLFYNAVIMDRAHNRNIVKNQLNTLERKENISRHPDYKFLQFNWIIPPSPYFGVALCVLSLHSA